MFSDAPGPRSLLHIRKILLGLQNPLHQIRRRRILQIEKSILIGKRARQILHRKAIVSRGNRSVRRKNAFAPHLLDVFAANRSPPGFFRFLTQQFQRQQRRMAFVHVVARQFGISQRAKHAHATDTQQHFLAQPVVGIAAIKAAGQRPVRILVVG